MAPTLLEKLSGIVAALRLRACCATLLLAGGVVIGSAVFAGPTLAASGDAAGGWTSVPLGTVIVSDDFSHFETKKNGRPIPGIRYANGRLMVSAPADDVRAFLMSHDIGKVAAAGMLTISADVTQSDASGQAGNGWVAMLFWAAGLDNYYMVRIRADRFSVSRYSGKGGATVVGWTRSAAIKTAPGAVNRIGIDEQRSYADVLINGVAVTRLDAPKKLAGHDIGFVCQAGKKAATTCSFAKFTMATADKQGGTTQQAKPSGEQIFADDFSVRGPGWGKPTASDHVAGHHFVMAMKPHQNFGVFNTKLRYAPGPADIKVSLEMQGTPPYGGLFFWASRLSNNFVFTLADDRFLVMRAFSATNYKVLDSGRPQAIRTGKGAVNQLEIRDYGDRADLLINGQMVSRVTAGPAKRGQLVGLYCFSPNADPATCRFSNLVVTRIHATAPAAVKAVVDPAIVGHWRLFVPFGNGVTRMDLTIDPDGHYAYRTDNPVFAPHSGTFSTTPDRHWVMSSPTWQDGGTYKLTNPDTLLLTGKLGPGVWSRVTR